MQKIYKQLIHVAVTAAFLGVISASYAITSESNPESTSNTGTTTAVVSAITSAIPSAGPIASAPAPTAPGSSATLTSTQTQAVLGDSGVPVGVGNAQGGSDVKTDASGNATVTVNS